MKLHLPYIVLLILAMLAASCVSKRLTKKGYELEQAGMAGEAADYYYRALLRKEDNIDARIGLKRTGQVVLDDALKRFYASYTDNRIALAVKDYIDARNYQEKVSSVGVSLDFPSEYSGYYREVKSTHLADTYREGYKLLREERFEEAENVFGEIMDLEKGYKNVQKLYTEARNEPLYREAKQAMEQKRFRKAYDLFSRILARSGTYKNTKSLKSKALEDGRVTVMLLPVQSQVHDKQLAELLHTELEARLAGLSNPFIQLIDGGGQAFMGGERNLSSLESDQDLAMYRDARAVLICRLQAYKAEEGDLQKEQKKGFLKREYKVRDPETGQEETRTRYEKVFYQEFQKENAVQCVLSYKLVATATGAVLSSDRFTVSESDRLHYADFKGDKRGLVPGYWEYKNKPSEKDEIRDHFRARLYLQQLLQNTRKIRTIASLREAVIAGGASRIAGKVNAYNPE